MAPLRTVVTLTPLASATMTFIPTTEDRALPTPLDGLDDGTQVLWRAQVAPQHGQLRHEVASHPDQPAAGPWVDIAAGSWGGGRAGVAHPRPVTVHRLPDRPAP